MRVSHAIIFCFLFSFIDAFAQKDSLIHVQGFGANPGNISLFYYAPQHPMPGKAPLVVVLHGCSETANSVNRLTGWSDLADRYGFYLLFPQQHITNNTSHCFNWFKMNEIERGKGEGESIREMIEYMKKHFPIDSSQVSVTGLSAGAAMSVVMIAAYPELFKAAAIFAGGPYKPGENYFSAMGSMIAMPDKTPEEWKRVVVEQNPAFKGEYPKVLIFHGKNDPVVNFRAAKEIMKQWTAVHETDTVPDVVEYPYTGNYDVKRKTYLDKAGKEAVLLYEFNNLGHALPVDPGFCRNQGGKKGLFGTDKNFYSTFYTAYEFGLVPGWNIEGKRDVQPGETDLTYTVRSDTNSTFLWTVPKGCEILGDPNKAVIHVKWNDQPGLIRLEEVDGNGCRYYHPDVRVKIQGN
ncbi:MAG: PHB depolymerase family esterase [Bacteroidetes bacterium]|nr:PHB depolymerase family esterase [Bacteroidota bacterium]